MIFSPLRPSTGTFYLRTPIFLCLPATSIKTEGSNEQAVADFTETINRNPKAVTAYVNRGYVLNDLRQSQPAADRF